MRKKKKIAKAQYPVSVNAWLINKDKRTQFKIGQSDEQSVNTGRNTCCQRTHEMALRLVGNQGKAKWNNTTREAPKALVSQSCLTL